MTQPRQKWKCQFKDILAKKLGMETRVNKENLKSEFGSRILEYILVIELRNINIKT